MWYVPHMQQRAIIANRLKTRLVAREECWMSRLNKELHERGSDGRPYFVRASATIGRSAVAVLALEHPQQGLFFGILGGLHTVDGTRAARAKFGKCDARAICVEHGRMDV